MKKRKLLTVLLAGVLLLAGCAGGQSTTPPATAQPEETEPPAPLEETPSAPLFTGPVSLIQSQPPQSGDPIAVMETNMGTIRIRLFPQYAPLTVENFIGLAQQGFYDGIIFHRVIENFMIQGGCPYGMGTGGMSIFLDENDNPQSFVDEPHEAVWNFRGALSMANSGPNTNMSQFFIVQNSDPLAEDAFDILRNFGFPDEVIHYYSQVGGTPHLDGLIPSPHGGPPSLHTVFGHVIEGMDVVDAIASVQTIPGDRPAQDVVIISVTIETA